MSFESPLAHRACSDALRPANRAGFVGALGGGRVAGQWPHVGCRSRGPVARFMRVQGATFPLALESQRLSRRSHGIVAESRLIQNRIRCGPDALDGRPSRLGRASFMSPRRRFSSHTADNNGSGSIRSGDKPAGRACSSKSPCDVRRNATAPVCALTTKRVRRGNARWRMKP